MPEDAADVPVDVARLFALLRTLERVAVAFSGGLDSAVVAAAGLRVGVPVRLLHVASPLQTSRERRMADQVASELGLVCEHLPVELDELQFLIEHPEDRCYRCKRLILGRLQALLAPGWVLVDGTQVDDDPADRPGSRAVAEFGVRSPLREAGLGKGALRRVAAAWGLSVAACPPTACLATRIPFGEAVTAERIRRIDAAEEALVARGLRDVRVRWRGDVAVIACGADERDRLADPVFRGEIESVVLAAGFAGVGFSGGVSS